MNGNMMFPRRFHLPKFIPILNDLSGYIRLPVLGFRRPAGISRFIRRCVPLGVDLRMTQVHLRTPFVCEDFQPLTGHL